MPKPFSWTIPIQRNFEARLGRLANVPEAIAHEAPNSWFMRVAASQGCSAKELAGYLGFTFQEDFDFQYYFVFRNSPCTAPQVRGLEPGRVFMALPWRKDVPGRLMYAPRRHRGIYRFCPLCLRFDVVPCIHLYTRMEELVFCPWHRCLLEEQCPHCQAHVELMQDMASSGSDGLGVEDISRCLKCGQALHSRAATMMDDAFVFKLPAWLRQWGVPDIAAVGGEGMPRADFIRERQRLKEAAPVASSPADARRTVHQALGQRPELPDLGRMDIWSGGNARSGSAHSGTGVANLAIPAVK